MIEHRATDIEGLNQAVQRQRSRETHMRRALRRILAAAEGDDRYAPMNWADVAEEARRALALSEAGTTNAGGSK